MSTDHLTTLLDALNTLRARRLSPSYQIPALWDENRTGTNTVDPAGYYSDIVSTIVTMEPTTGYSSPGTSADEWSQKSIVYNLFVRLTTAFDHNGDGTISDRTLVNGFRETGTFLKSIALLPYLKRMGIDTVYLLPVTEPGRCQRKGSLGSPYAVRNPYRIDPLLSEPALELTAEKEFSAFMEATKLMGMRVVLEFVFRTSAVDSDWVKEHPDWYYWLLADRNSGSHPGSYASPVFDQDTLNKIYEQVDKHDFTNLPEPDTTFRQRFTVSPEKVIVTDTEVSGVGYDGKKSVVASAFSDWPPDDQQPPWTDVAYLKLHNHDEFNYIAYNTIRMYDTELDQPGYANTELWNTLCDIIPFFQNRYSIHGAMIDMGHALPPALKKSIVEKARKNDPDFAFWDENFDPSPTIKDEGFNAVFGSLPFVIKDPVFIRGLLNFLNKTGIAVPFFGTGESHNTPRVCHNLEGNAVCGNRARFIFGLACMLPAIPFIHSGMEICEAKPVNLGLNFTDKDREKWKTDTLPLFSPGGYDWAGCNGEEPLTAFIAKMLSLRKTYETIILNGKPGFLSLPFVSSPDLMAIMRKGEERNLLFIGNSNCKNNTSGYMEFLQKSFTLKDMISGNLFSVDEQRLQLEMKPGECLVFDIPVQP